MNSIHWLVVIIQCVRALSVILGASLVGRTILAMRQFDWRNWTLVGQRRAKFLIALISAVTISSFLAISVHAPVTAASFIQILITTVFVYGHRYLDTVIPANLHKPESD